MSPAVLAELVIKVCSTRLRLVVAEAMFRNLCCKSGLTVVDDELSLKKMVSTPVNLLIPLVNHQSQQYFTLIVTSTGNGVLMETVMSDR